jgi:hypothetical protein
MKQTIVKSALMQVRGSLLHCKAACLLLLLFLLSCFITACSESDVSAEDSIECVSGVIVGQKCKNYALRVDKKGQLGAKDWVKRTDKPGGGSDYTTYDNVIGLVELPDAYRREGLKVFVKLRKPTEEESIVPCYTDMPNPPDPVYIVLVADSTSCPGEVYN